MVRKETTQATETEKGKTMTAAQITIGQKVAIHVRESGKTFAGIAQVRGKYQTATGGWVIQVWFDGTRMSLGLEEITA